MNTSQGTINLLMFAIPPLFNGVFLNSVWMQQGLHPMRIVQYILCIVCSKYSEQKCPYPASQINLKTLVLESVCPLARSNLIVQSSKWSCTKRESVSIARKDRQVHFPRSQPVGKDRVYSICLSPLIFSKERYLALYRTYPVSWCLA